MPCHFPAGQPTKKSSSKPATLWELMQHYSTIQFEISQAIDKAYLTRSSNLRKILNHLLFLSLLQQTHIKTIKLSGRKGSGRSNAIPCSDTRCRKTTLAFKPTSSSSSTEMTSWLNVKPFPVTEAKPIAHTSQKSSSKGLRGSEGCKRGASLLNRMK